MKPISHFIDRIIHGDSIHVMRTMPTASVDLVIADPPYLVRYKPRDGRGYPNDDNSAWLRPAYAEMHRVLKPDTFCISFYGWPWIDRFMAAWREAGFRPVSHLVWVKSYSSREGYTRSYHEVGFLLAKGRPPRAEKPPRDIFPWRYTANTLHPTEKPVVAITPLIENFSSPGSIILDPFAGSGTTGVAARNCGRHFIIIETVEHYYKAARARLSQLSSPAQGVR